MKTYWRNPQIFKFIRENFSILAKILRLISKVWRVILKGKNVTKKLIFTKLFASFVVKNALKPILGRINKFLV